MSGAEPVTFGILVSRYRVAVGLTQEELAERAGLSVRGISDIERGVRTQPRPHTVRQLAEALQLALEDRTLFEQTAIAAGATSPMDDAFPEGSFLGALPASRLVAREEELERIRSVLDAMAKGTGHLLLLSGEVGVGKTRLLQEAMVEATGKGYVVLTGRCYASDHETPYYTLLEALPALMVRAPGAVRPEVQRGWKRVQQLISSRSAVNGGEKGTQVAQQQLFDALSDLLLLVARSVPLALLLDDLHWADPDSLKLLQHLAHTTRSSPILLAGSFCDHRLNENHPALAQALQTMSHERLMERLSVRRLSLEETTQLVAVTMDNQEVSEEFASFVYRRTKGNPRLIDQLVRSLGGRLELQGEIGAGSMGRVFRALDRTLGTVVAAKLVLARSEIDLDTLLRFQQEGAVLARLEHPHIVRIYDTFAEEHATCIIMELLDGQSLGAVLQDGPLPLPRAKGLALQVTEALGYAHSQGIVHRDIKPDNVMVLEGDQVKVTDFGIARILQPDTSLQTIATTGMRMGTPLYMAPEQIEGKRIDGRTDIYALGAMLYHMLTGRPPFEGNDALAVAVKHLQEEPVPPSWLNPAIPAASDAVILKAMAKDPAQRYQTAGALQHAIAELPSEQGDALRAVAGQDTPTSGGQSWPDPPWAGPRRGATGTSQRGGTAWHATLTAPRMVRSAWRRAGALPRLASVVIALVCLAAALGVFVRSPWSSIRTHGFAGKPIAVWGVKIPPRFLFRSPENLSAPVQGDLYIGDYDHPGIIRVTTAGKLLAAWGTKGKGPGEFESINDIAVDSQRNVYVADEFNNRIEKFSANGKLLASFGRFGFNPGEFYRPGAITIDAHGNMIVADSYNDRIQKLSPTGKPLLVWGSPGPLPGQVHGPNVIRLDAQGNIYVSEHVNKRIQKFSPSGKSLAIIGGPGTGPGKLTDPQGLAFDAQGNIYVLEHDLSRVQKFSPTGKLLAVWDRHGSRPGEFNGPQTISIDRQNRVYVADSGNGRVQVLSTNGRPLAEWKTSDLLRRPFRRPLYVALDRHGNAYVSDAGHNAIEKVSPRGDLLLRWGRTGSGLGQFRRPAGIALDAAGNVFVADTGNGRIQEFSPGGTFVTGWPVRVAGTSRRGSPIGLALDRQGSIYVTDPVNGVVQGYSRPHELRIQWGRSNPSHPLYRLKKPTGIAVDHQGNVYVADTGNHRVVEFAALDVRGKSLPEGHSTGAWSGAPGSRQLLQPAGVAVDGRGNIYVTDSSGSSVQVFAPDGKLLAHWGAKGSDPGRFQDPTGIALDAAGNIYVADMGNARIQKFPSLS